MPPTSSCRDGGADTLVPRRWRRHPAAAHGSSALGDAARTRSLSVRVRPPCAAWAADTPASALLQPRRASTLRGSSVFQPSRSAWFTCSGVRARLVALPVLFASCASSETSPSGPTTTCGAAPLDGAGRSATTFVFRGGDGERAVYRIPSLVATPKGALLAFAEGRPSVQDPGSGGIDVVLRRSVDCGRTWSSSTVLAHREGGDAHNPAAVLAKAPDGTPRVFLFYAERPATPGGEADLPPGIGAGSASVWVRTSDDDGVSWTAPRDLTAAVKPPAWAIFSPGPGLALHATRGGAGPLGRILVPGWYTTPPGTEGSFVFASEDGGATYHLLGVPTPGTNEAQVFERGDGRLVLDARQPEGQPARALFASEDGGATWSSGTPGLTMTPVMSSVLRWDDATALHSGVAPKSRQDLRVLRSDDGGISFAHETILAEGFAQYSVLARLDDGSVGLLYEGLDTSEGLSFDVRFTRVSVSALH